MNFTLVILSILCLVKQYVAFLVHFDHYVVLITNFIRLLPYLFTMLVYCYFRQTARIREQLDCLGLSLDWDREYFTLSPKHSRAVTEAFVRLHEIGLIYRAAGLVSWCCYLQSAISDIEVETRELHEATLLSVPGYEQPQPFGIVDYFAYPLVRPSPRRSGKVDSHIVVATTRLETMLGDAALVVHPDDARYSHLIGQSVIHPFCPTGRQLPIIADADLVDPTKGTGVVKLSPGHSLIDWEAGRTHNLPVLNVLDSAGCVTALGGEFVGLPRFTARQRLVERLSDLGLYRKREDISFTGTVTVLPICSRSGDVIEPLVREQWFVRTTQIAEQAAEAVRSSKLSLHPRYQNALWYEWLSPGKHRDWCISRQLWWGHRIPAYRVRHLPEDCKDRSNEVTTDSNTSHMWVVARSVEEASQLLNCVSSTQLIEQGTVNFYWCLPFFFQILMCWILGSVRLYCLSPYLDGLTRLSNIWTPDLKRFYPMQLLETGQDILFFWVARMVMLGIHLTRRIPFRQVLLHGLVCDATGQKMSKSKGNVIDPLDLVNGIGSLSRGCQSVVGSNITALGADALRASLVACPLSQPQVAYSLESALDMRKFCNKIWQTARFALACLEHSRSPPLTVVGQPLEIVWRQLSDPLNVLHLADLWLVSRLANLVELIRLSWTPDLVDGLQETNSSFNSDARPSFELHKGVQKLRLWWTEDFCSVYLEILKCRRKDSSRPNGFNVFYASLLTALHLLHPVMPHVTEVVWQGLRLAAAPENGSESTSLSLQPFPSINWVQCSCHVYSILFCCRITGLLHRIFLSMVHRLSPVLSVESPVIRISCASWFRFLGVVDRELELRQSMANLLDTVASVNAWRPILRQVSDTTSPKHLCYLSHEINHSAHPDELEVLTSLTRISPVCDPSLLPPHGICFPVAPKSRWCLIVDSEAFDLNWTEQELERRLHAQTKRKEQLTHQLSQVVSEQQLKAVHHKLESIKTRIASLDYQLGVIRQSQKTRT
ncbi:valyl-tRNA synthetase [Paragonimus westermani]|uniref:valine--tRNA ligase n=1 Tax=Paragonimus westermani TaxID=34504 RepID=A0A5J4NSR8_9TREM|nr:valyl-tRNA synthetase [Paragonimus westermani]